LSGRPGRQNPTGGKMSILIEKFLFSALNKFLIIEPHKWKLNELL
jgi:hypothetical protein